MPPKFSGEMPLKQEENLSTPTPTPPWIELPSDLTSNILHRLGAVEILDAAQKVCTTWHRVCKDPDMWRIIDMHTDDFMSFDLAGMCRQAVDRSLGQLVDITLEHFASDELLDYIAITSGCLRRLRLNCCYNLSNGALTESLKRFPYLESLNVTDVRNISIETIEMIGSCFCPLLTSFAFNLMGTDEEAFVIARSMPELRHLQMLDNKLTHKGLEAILDGCLHLESLDLDRSYCLELEGSALEKRILSSQIKRLTYSKCCFQVYHSNTYILEDDDLEDCEPSSPYKDRDFFNYYHSDPYASDDALNKCDSDADPSSPYPYDYNRGFFNYDCDY